VENDSQKSLVIPFLLYNALDSDGICMIVSCFGMVEKQEGKTVFFGMAQNHAITEIPYIPCPISDFIGGKRCQNQNGTVAKNLLQKLFDHNDFLLCKMK
jgi:hypothetical protein